MLSLETVVDAPVSHVPPAIAHILVIEDEDLIRETLVLALQDEGFQTITATDGHEALSLINSHLFRSHADLNPAIDLIILDLMLPGVSGLDLCRLIRREGCTVPILMISAKGSEIDRVVGLEIGADDYLSKPFGMREMVARCRALLRRVQPQHFASPPVLRFQELCLYPQECRVTLRGEEVSLSPKEYKLLELFMRQPRRVWSREQLLDQVWGHDFIGDSKTVDVHIRWLREKIEVDPSHPEYILTVRGFGYRLG
ncbi:DNA-binding response regulator [Parathermosynechococcus lividus PCC 6715]|uniref:DNA-binding response regulator n=1 Tax=Parathermosynechococcus lividus PCC 6715 TaxID=1917166 RepID=A0A2D2PZZ2_PARLV|nr:response regulator transcription factor [Thermostichus lividus]ATS17607.1 DNA-binding response regulator [Thermostichus lividus PCC 6715]